MLRTRIAVAALVVAAVGATAATIPVTAQAATATVAKVTVVHGIPNTPVDVYVDNKLTLKDFTFGKVAGPLALKPGAYAIAIRAAGASAMAKPVLSDRVTVRAGENASIVAHLTASGAPTLSVFANPTAAPAMGDARVIVRHLAAAPGVDVYAGSTKVVTDLTNPRQAVLSVPAGTVAIKVDVTGTTTTVIGPANFHFAAGTTTIVYAIGSATAKPSTLTVATQTY